MDDTDGADDIVEHVSAMDFPTTLARLRAAIEGAGMTVFAAIDHAAGAASAGLAMPPATVLLYGNPKGGTPLMLAAPPQVQAGRMFGVALAAPPGITGVQVELVFDSVKLQAVGAEGTPGRVQVAVAGTTTVRLRALEGQSGQAQVEVGHISAGTTSAGESIQLNTPAPVTINIVP